MSSSRLSSSRGSSHVVKSEVPRKSMAKLGELDVYMEKLYDDDVESKLEGAKMILQLAEFAGFIESLVQDESLMSLLSRVLNDEYKKSYDLSLTLMRIFWCFSNFLQLHLVLANYRIGTVTLRIVEFELKRHDLRLEEEKQLIAAAKDVSNVDTNSTNDILAKIDREKKRNNRRMRKQDQLLNVCFSVLLNLAEDIHTEHKMVKRKVVLFLTKLLDRVAPDLVILTITFLKKLSIFEENKDAMVELMVVEKLLYVKCFVDDRCKSMFTYTDAIPIVMQLVINFPQNVVAKELAALAVNLSHNARNAELMCQNRGLEALATRVFRTRDLLLMKVIRNISLWSYTLQEDLVSEKAYKYRAMWAPFVVPFIELCLNTDNHDFSIEVLATLANMTPNDLSSKTSWDILVTDHALIPLLNKFLVPGFSQDDMILEVVLFVSALALEPRCAPLLSSSRLIRTLHSLFQEKQHDRELTLQLLYAFYRMLRHPETFEEIVFGAGFVPDLLLVAESSNIEVRRMCDIVMDLILDHELNDNKTKGEFGHLICRRRFEIHNAEYLEMIHVEKHNTMLSKHRGMDHNGGKADDDDE
ncbi:kinesin-associated protein 3-like [Plasmopara halstedii]|uniref:Kinesin-associated protein 3-like n=1 Tax=Plasmopara halstedii TaxID=4781 RepID=A0A0P1AI11_PLAHL|nr:kinesin-associated protein 3-like [Plasmopara halstedii]CEG40929.1 kinesin-associated protein 3-like [Plasmopara halstedii]|eukprot:XP_024577298.1 kinesin-associated protein 3-like [Plasmopara halstedii]